MRATHKDINRVNQILGHESVYPIICDDTADHSMRYQLGGYYIKCPQVIVLLPDENTVFIGIPRSGTMWEVHLSILPAGRGKAGVINGKLAIKWMWENVPNCFKLVAFIPEFNRPVHVFARLCGWTQEGRLTRSFLKDGKLHDQIIYGKEKPSCHQ